MPPLLRPRGSLAYFTANAFSVDVAVAGRNPNAPPAFTVPVAAPLSNLPIDGVSVTLHEDVPTQSTVVVPAAWTIVPNLPVFCAWLNATSIPTVPGAEHVTVPVTVAAPVCSLTATLGAIAGVTLANRSSSNAPMSQVPP